MAVPVRPSARRTARRAAHPALAALAAACLTVAGLAGLAACGHSSAAGASQYIPEASLSRDGMAMGMDGMASMSGMDMSGTGDDMPGLTEPTGPRIAAADPADDGLHASVGGYSYVADASTVPGGAVASFAFHVTGPSGKVLTRFESYEGQLLEFYLVDTDLSGFRRLTASMRENGTWTVPLPALAAGSYRTYVTFAAPDSSEGTPLSYSLSQPLTVPGTAAAAALPPAAATTTVDGYTLTLTGSPKKGVGADLGVAVAKDGKPVQQFDRILDGYAHLTAFHGGDAAFARALSTGRSAGGPSGAGSLTAKISFPESGAVAAVRPVRDLGGGPHGGVHGRRALMSPRALMCPRPDKSTCSDNKARTRRATLIPSFFRSL